MTEPPTRVRRVTSIALIVMCQSIGAIVTGGIALFLPIIRADLGLTFTEAGAIASAGAITYACMQIPAGILADRFGPRRLFLIGLTGLNVVTILFTQLHVYWTLIASQATAGIFRSLIFAPGMLLVGSRFPPTRRATALGLYVSGGFSSNILLNLIGPAVVGPLGWRGLFLLVSVVSMAIVIVYWRVDASWPDEPGNPRAGIRDGLRLFRHPRMWMIAVIQYTRLSVAAGVSYRIPTFIVVDRGQSLQVAGLIVGAGAVITALSNFAGGYLSDRFRKPAVIIGSSFLMLAVTTSLIPRADIGVLPAVIVVNSLFMQLYFGPLFAWPIQMLGPRAAGMTSGFGNFFANLGAVTFTLALGAVKDATGSFDAGFHAVSALCLIGFACTVALARMKPSTPTEGEASARP